MENPLIPRSFGGVVLTALAAVCVHGAGSTEQLMGSHPLPPGTELLLPVGGPRVSWARVSPKPLFREATRFRFDIDGHGRPTFGFEGAILDPGRGLAIELDVPLVDFAWLENGELVACAEGALGALERPQPGDGGLIRAHFTPSLMLPSRHMRLFPGTKGSLYLAGRDSRTNKETLFLLQVVTKSGRGEGDGLGRAGVPATDVVMRKLVEMDRPVTAATGDGGTTFFAAGRLIARLGPGRSTAERAYLHPGQEITGLAISSSGLFYATSSGVGHIDAAGKGTEFLATSDPQIRIRNNTLFVMLGQDQEVLEFNDLQRF